MLEEIKSRQVNIDHFNLSLLTAGSGAMIIRSYRAKITTRDRLKKKSIAPEQLFTILLPRRQSHHG